MITLPIEVLACSADGEPPVDQDVRDLADHLTAAEPRSILVTGDLLFDLWTLHVYVKKKLEVVPGGTLVLVTSRPQEIAHEIDPRTGKWIKVRDSVSLVYEVRDDADPLRTAYVGLKAASSGPTTIS